MIILPQANAITTFVGALHVAELLCSIVSGVIILPQVPLQLLQQCHHVIVEEHFGAKEAHLIPIKACYGVHHGMWRITMGAVVAHHGAVVAHHGAVVAHHGAVVAHYGAMEAYHGAGGSLHSADFWFMSRLRYT